MVRTPLCGKNRLVEKSTHVNQILDDHSYISQGKLYFAYENKIIPGGLPELSRELPTRNTVNRLYIELQKHKLDQIAARNIKKQFTAQMLLAITGGRAQ